MIKEAEKDLGKYLLLGIIIILVVLSYKILAQYIVVLISSFVFTYLLRPVYKFFNKHFNKYISAIICILIILFIFVLPMTIVITNVGMQAYSSFDTQSFNDAVEKISSMKIFEKINIDFQKVLYDGGMFFVSLLGSAASYIPSIIISFIVFLFAAYYSFINWDSLVKLVSRFIPFDKKTSVIKEIKNSTDGIIHGYLLLALIEFVVSAAGFYLSGVQYYLLLSFIIAILVFIPGLGAIAVIIPMLIYYFVLGNWYSFIGVLITGIIVSFFIEIILSAKLLSEDSAVHPMIMLLGILGGTAVFGLFGFIIGPLVLVYTLKILKDLLSRI